MGDPMRMDPDNTEFRTQLLTELITADWERKHPGSCNCERCDYRLTVAFSKVLRRVLGGAK